MLINLREFFLEALFLQRSGLWKTLSWRVLDLSKTKPTIYILEKNYQKCLPANRFTLSRCFGSDAVMTAFWIERETQL